MKSATNFVAGDSYIAAGEPTCAILPWFMTPMRDDSVIASSWSCVTTMKVTPRCF